MDKLRRLPGLGRGGTEVRSATGSSKSGADKESDNPLAGHLASIALLSNQHEGHRLAANRSYASSMPRQTVVAIVAFKEQGDVDGRDDGHCPPIDRLTTPSLRPNPLAIVL